jgi:hypothetical protein
LISIKVDFSGISGNEPPTRRSFAMPQETMIIVAGVVAVFVIFATVLAWANHRTMR